MEEEPIVREKKIFAVLKQEIEEGEDMADEAGKMVSYLLLEKKGYSADEVRSNVVFDVKLGDEAATSSVDFVVSVGGSPGMVIKCAAGSLASRERQAVAAARLISSPPVPIAVVADPLTAEVLDVQTGKVTGEGFGAIPVREQLLQILEQSKLQPLPPARIEKEKRILLAFDAIRCYIPKGADGGVKLDDVCNDE